MSVSEEDRTKAIEAVAPYPAVVVDQLIGLGWTPPVSAPSERVSLRIQLESALAEHSAYPHLAARAVLAVLPSRETVAPTEKQIAQALWEFDNAEHPGAFAAIGPDDHDRYLRRARAVRSLFPGELREAVEAEARAEGRREYAEWIEDQHALANVTYTQAVMDAWEHFGIEAPCPSCAGVVVMDGRPMVCEACGKPIPESTGDDRD